MIKEIRSWSKPNIDKLIGRKKVDWSIFEYGTHIPIEFHDDFAMANANHFLKVGERVDIKLLIEDKTFIVQLVNFRRKDSDKGALQLRYDTNRLLKDFLISTFNTSYKYLENNREEKSKKPVHTPIEMEESIDFVQTEEPYVYRVILNTKKGLSFWWVNQGQTYKEERDNEFLWAPQKSKQGIPLPHHVGLVKPKVGDIVFCYSSMEIKSIGIVQEEAVEAPKPSVIATHNWEEDGYLVKLKYFDIDPSIKKNDIPIEWRLEEAGPFDRNGNLKQGYFFELTEGFARKLFNLFNERFPTEVRNKLLEYKPKEQTIKITENPKTYLSNSDLVNHIYTYIKAKGFYYKKEEVINLFLSLKTKPFVILSGISGTGKTKMVQWFAESVGATEENGQFALIPIRPDWNDGSDLLGYVDIKGEFKEGPLTRVLKRAENHPELPYFVLLDEMNLARVEYYFSDILSVMESRKWKNGNIVSTNLLSEEIAGFDLKLPNNLYIVGTVNMDETTHPFSKKVLDRANTIEFNRIALGNLSFLHEQAQVDPIVSDQDSFASTYLHLKDLFVKNNRIVELVTTELERMNAALQLINAHVGYRVRDEICFYMAYNEEASLMEFSEALDHCILQKILPRVSGSDMRLDQLLKKLYVQFTNKQFEEDVELTEQELQSAKYPKSAEKVVEMLGRLRDDGFTSFWIS